MKRLVACGAVIWARQNSDLDRQFLPRAAQIAANFAIVFGKWERGVFTYIRRIEDICFNEKTPQTVDREDHAAFLAFRAPMVGGEVASRWLSAEAGAASNGRSGKSADDEASRARIGEFRRRLFGNAMRPLFITDCGGTVAPGTPFLMIGNSAVDDHCFAFARSGDEFNLSCIPEQDAIEIVIDVNGASRAPKEYRLTLSGTFAV